MNFSWFNPPPSQARAFAWALNAEISPARARFESLSGGVVIVRCIRGKVGCDIWLWAYDIANNWGEALGETAKIARETLGDGVWRGKAPRGFDLTSAGPFP